MRKKLKRLLLSERGDSSYISSFIYILVAVVLIAFIINVFHIISTKQEMDHIADQLVKQIQLNGGTSGDTAMRCMFPAPATTGGNPDAGISCSFRGMTAAPSCSRSPTRKASWAGAWTGRNVPAP